MRIGSGAVLETVDLLLEGKVNAIPQEQFMRRGRGTPSGTEDLQGDLPHRLASADKKIYDFIRGLSPYPAAWTELVDKEGVRQRLKIFQSEKDP